MGEYITTLNPLLAGFTQRTKKSVLLTCHFYQWTPMSSPITFASNTRNNLNPNKRLSLCKHKKLTAIFMAKDYSQ
jgi:hypothetical protein